MFGSMIWQYFGRSCFCLRLYPLCVTTIFFGSFLLSNSEVSVRVRLNDFIRHYEPLDYDPSIVLQNHGRWKRWAEGGTQPESEPQVSFNLKAHGKNFRIRLRRDKTTFGEHFELALGTDDAQPFLENIHLFEGDLEDLPGTSVYGSLQDGIFEGKIVTPHDTYYVEKSSKFFKPGENRSHSVIYAGSDLDLEAIHLGPNGTRMGAIKCGCHQIQGWMSKIHSFSVPGVENSVSYSEPDALDSHISSYSIARQFSRRKRQASLKPSQRTTCELQIRTDPMLWRFIAKQGGRREKALISEEILSIIGQHVKAANEIFANTLFDGETAHKNIQFVVRRVKIDTDEECSVYENERRNPFCAENIDVSNFLDLHSRTNYEDFCLSYVFTYRDFADGVVGLAWVASPDASGATGGICEKYTGIAGFSSGRSLNTGIVTFLNYNRRLPPRISHLTFAHELGHNFGASHDPGDETCQPGGKYGNYLMYSSATNGYLPNNNQFSRCSVTDIAAVLDKIFDPSRASRNCFKATLSTFCGNQIVEEGEECDCGYNDDECDDQCCIPRRAGSGDTSKRNERACKRTPGSICSPSEGPCCESDCNFSPKSEHQLKLCEIESECTETSYCDGISPQCPIPMAKPSNETLCNNGTQVCMDGVCRGSLCIKHGFEECSLRHEEYPDTSTLCNLACFNKEGTCVSILELGVSNLPSALKLRPGTPCDDFRGYCDVFQKCRRVDEDGPLRRLTRTFFNKETYRNVVDWIKGNPWWSGIIGFIFLLLFAGFVKCCAVHTPSSNPHLPHHLKFSETLQRPIRTLQRRPRRGNAQTQHGPQAGYEMGPPRGRRKNDRPLPSERASMVPFN